MATYKPKESDEWILTHANNYLQELRNGGKLHITILSTSKSNMSYTYRVRLVYWDGEEVQDVNLSYFLACLWRESVNVRWEGDCLKGNGIGTDRYFLAAYNIGQSFKALGLIDDPYEIANRTVYREV